MRTNARQLRAVPVAMRAGGLILKHRSRVGCPFRVHGYQRPMSPGSAHTVLAIETMFRTRDDNVRNSIATRPTLNNDI